MISSIAVALTVLSQAPSVKVSLTPPPPPIAVRAARMVDVKAGRLVEHPQIIVRGKVIVAVGTSADAPPVGAEIVDLKDMTLLPGLIDCHTHLSTTDRKSTRLNSSHVALSRMP